MLNKKTQWKPALLRARESWYLANYQAARDFGVPAKIYSDKTANGLTNCIIDFLKYNGCYANRISTTGMPVILTGAQYGQKAIPTKARQTLTAL